MNERIKELAKQAGINCVVPTVGTLEYSSKGEIEHLKKFTELIVRECLNIALYGDEFEQARSNVKQHFGVEE